MYEYNLVMCVIHVCNVSEYLRGKFQENKSIFGPDYFWRWVLLSLQYVNTMYDYSVWIQCMNTMYGYSVLQSKECYLVHVGHASIDL